MKNAFFLFFFLIASVGVFSQTSPTTDQEKPPIDYYKIISANRDTTHVDTTLNIRRMYRFNYLRRDNFELLQFSNVGQTYNSLGYTFDNRNLKPLFVAQSHHFNYRSAEDVSYYNVPTPLTELYFKTAYTQGQQLDAFFTVNTSPRLNFSIQYKGVRSLGKYQHILTSTGDFLFTTNYKTKNLRYHMRAHFSAQSLLNQENGGLRDSSIPLFVNNDPEFRDRGRLDVKFENAENILKGQRAYLDHYYHLVAKGDSTSYSLLTIGNELRYEEKAFRFFQDSPYREFGPSYESAGLYTKTSLQDFNAKAYANFEQSLLGKFSAWINYNDFNYGYNSMLNLDNGQIPNRIKGHIVSAGGGYTKQYRGFAISGEGAVNIEGEFVANYLKGTASYNLNDDYIARASIGIHSAAPNFNFILYQNDYKNYNWKTDLNNVKTQELKFEIETKKYGKASVSYTGIDDYTYFGVRENDSTPSPMQSGKRVNYLKIKAEKEFEFGKFAFDNTIMYQEVMGGTSVLNVPRLLSRNTLYYKDHWFRKALYLETGVSMRYFTKYNMNAYDPVLAEFYVQNDDKFGGFPLVDLFFNARVQQTRIYFVYENFTALFGGKNEYFAAPGYPYRDSVFRFGVVWNFFL